MYLFLEFFILLCSVFPETMVISILRYLAKNIEIWNFVHIVRTLSSAFTILNEGDFSRSLVNVLSGKEYFHTAKPFKAPILGTLSYICRKSIV